MSQLADKTFKGGKYTRSSSYGWRSDPFTGKRAWHNGTDYATGGKKIPQYAVEEGTVTSCGIDKNGNNAKYVWVNYPRLKKKILYYHLDSITVKKGQSVNNDTQLGLTGKTGRATGIHLHMGLFDFNGKAYDPDTYTIPKVENIVVNDNVYIVKSGDYLIKIGKKIGMDWQELAKINGIKKPYTIYTGQVLKLNAKPTVENQAYYKVLKGDYLIKIGKMVKTPWTTIAKLNGIKPPYIIRVGQILRIK